ncbi:unnamed protein product [Owenia fusiformis]|uniref:GAIN-B domain-containing protein n=1 Tax=Owenia fusiformis TaxID=6347 RepID=A0A8S4NXP1_OWEFU|nr:unnamed protein product [Owenia fusiformis]
MKENPYTWHSSADSVTTDLMGIVLRNSQGHELNIENLSENLTISLPTKGIPHMDRVQLSVPISELEKSTPTMLSDYKDRDILVVEFRADEGSAVIIYVKPVEENITLKVYVKEDERPDMNDMNSNATRIPHDADTLYRSRTDKTAHPNVIYMPKSNHNRTLFIGILLENNNPRNSEFVAGYNMSGIPENETQGLHLELDIGTYTFNCLFWNEFLQMWSDAGCDVSPLATPGGLSCDCNHMTTFSGSFFVIPNVAYHFGHENVFLTSSNNPVTASVISAVWLLYIILVVYAKRHDRKDTSHVSQ